MKFEEFLAAGGVFVLHGGPHDGEAIPALDYGGWPSRVYVPQVFEVGHSERSVYQMRIGSLDAYDYVGEEGK